MKNLANANGYKYIKDINSFYGKINGYYFYSEPTKYVGLIRIFFTIAPLELDEIKSICSKYRAVGSEGVRYEQGHLILELKTNGLHEPAQLNEILDIVSKKLSIQEADGHQSDLGLYRDGTRIVVRNNEIFNKTSRTSASLYKRQANKPALYGYLMAAIYMIPGSIFYAIALGVGIIPSIISFTIIYLALKGYHQHSGTPSRTELYIILGISFVGVMLGYYFNVGYHVGNVSLKLIIPTLVNIPISQVIKSSLWSFVIALAFNYYSIMSIFNTTRTGVAVSRKLKRLM